MTLPSENGSVSTITHLDVLDDQDSITTWTYASYLDLGAYSDVAGGASDKIVSGTSGNDSIDGTYTGDGDGDIVDNDDGNPNEETGNNDTITAGAGDDTIHGGTGDDSISPKATSSLTKKFRLRVMVRQSNLISPLQRATLDNSKRSQLICWMQQVQVSQQHGCRKSWPT